MNVSIFLVASCINQNQGLCTPLKNNGKIAIVTFTYTCVFIKNINII